MKNDIFKKLASRLKTPDQVQKYLHTLDYNRGETLFSARTAIAKKKAHCLEGVFIAAAILERLGYEPYVLSLESQDGLDHCVFVYQVNGRWGSIGKSRDHGIAGRAPRFRSLKDLVWSYFDPYIDRTGRITAWQVAHLDEVHFDWRLSSKNVWGLENHLLKIRHHPLKATRNRYKKMLKRYLKKGELPPRKFWR